MGRCVKTSQVVACNILLGVLLRFALSFLLEGLFFAFVLIRGFGNECLFSGGCDSAATKLQFPSISLQKLVANGRKLEINTSGSNIEHLNKMLIGSKQAFQCNHHFLHFATNSFQLIAYILDLCKMLLQRHLIIHHYGKQHVLQKERSTFVKYFMKVLQMLSDL